MFKTIGFIANVCKHFRNEERFLDMKPCQNMQMKTLELETRTNIAIHSYSLQMAVSQNTVYVNVFSLLFTISNCNTGKNYNFVYTAAEGSVTDHTHDASCNLW